MDTKVRDFSYRYDLELCDTRNVREFAPTCVPRRLSLHDCVRVHFVLRMCTHV